jgi:hypothetical protein
MVWQWELRNAYQISFSGHPGKSKRVEHYIKMDLRDISCCDNTSIGGLFPPEKKRPGHEANHSPLSTAEVENRVAISPLPLTSS